MIDFSCQNLYQMNQATVASSAIRLHVRAIKIVCNNLRHEGFKHGVGSVKLRKEVSLSYCRVSIISIFNNSGILLSDGYLINFLLSYFKFKCSLKCICIKNTDLPVKIRRIRTPGLNSMQWYNVLKKQHFK